MVTLNSKTVEPVL